MSYQNKEIVSPPNYSDSNVDQLVKVIRSIRRKEIEEKIEDLKNQIRSSSNELMNDLFHDLRILEEEIIDLQIQDCEDFLQKINSDEYGNDPDGFLGFRYESELKYLKSLKGY